MRYTVREAIDKLNKLIEENPKIENAVLGVYTKDEFYEDQFNVSYNLDIEADGYYDANGHGTPQFTFGEHEDNEEEEDDEYEDNEEEEDDEYEYEN